MFTNKKLEEEHRGKYGSPRVEYLQELVNKFQNTKDEETREIIAANLANFAYDPYNYTFLRQLNVLELFLDCIREPNVKLVEFGIGGICNSCVDPTNVRVIIQCGGIQAILQCLERDDAGNSVSLAHLKEKPTAAASSPPSSSESSEGVNYVASKILASAAATESSVVETVPFGVPARGIFIPSFAADNPFLHSAYLIFNHGDALFLCLFSSPPNITDLVKSIHFMGGGDPVCHAFDDEAEDQHDFVIGLSSGDVYVASLREQLKEFGKRLVGAYHYNRDGYVNNSRCTSVAWVPGGSGTFVVSHSDGNLYVYQKAKDMQSDSIFPPLKDPTQFSATRPRSTRTNPVARWHISPCSIKGLAFSKDGSCLATVSRDGYLRVFDFVKERLLCGGKSYYGSLLCCAWSMDGKYIVAGGEDDLIHVWSMEEGRMIAWGEGHNSWVSGISFDPWPPTLTQPDCVNMVYRFVSVGQDGRMLMWDVSMREMARPTGWWGPPGGRPVFSVEGEPWSEERAHDGRLKPSPSTYDVPRFSPVVSHRAHAHPIASLLFTPDSILTTSHEGRTMVWARPPSTSAPADQCVDF